MSNKIYVINNFANTVSIINGGNNIVINTVLTGSIPNAIAINPVSNKIYVTNFGTNNVTVIDGATNSVSATVPVGTSPGVMAVNPITNKVYVVNQSSGNITVIDGANNPKNVATGSAPMAVVINPATNRIYVLNIDSPNNYVSAGVSVIDGTNDTKLGNNIPITGHFLKGLTLNATNNKIYVSADESSGGAGDAFVAVIDVVNNNAVTKVNMGNLEAGILAANPVTGKLYDAWVGTVTVIDGADNVNATIVAGTLPASVAVIAMISHARCASSKLGTNGLSRRTAGTLLTTFDKTAMTPASTAVSLSRRCATAAVTSGVSTIFSNPATTTNRPTNITNSGQSMSM